MEPDCLGHADQEPENTKQEVTDNTSLNKMII
jgi:hypothetical protein